MDAHSVFMPPARESKRVLSFTPKREEQKRVEESMEDEPAAEKRVSAAPNDRIDDDYRL